MGKNILKGVFLVGLGATSYGMLATMVKLSYKQGYTTAEVTSSQMILGIIGMLIINFFQKRNKNTPAVKATNKNKLHLIIAGTSMGFTSVFYYLAVVYIPVSIGIVLLMQTVWMGVVLEALLTKTLPSLRKVIAVIIVLAGTIMATNLLNTTEVPNWRGIVLGLLAAAAFTANMFTASRIAVHLPPSKRSLYMLYGGAVIVLTFTAIAWPGTYNFDIFIKWGLVLAIFGTIIPPLLLNKGFPLTGIGLGSIVSSLELPVSVTMAFIILQEKVTLTQWTGITLIILAVIIMNIKYRRDK
ncbi:EamA family transporter [Flavobacterium sp. C4GT6]|uniref:EamA family transporter n=1 Tax=Flavobacterium sp. C4GT6 TaxID=3103818 RepID=UPI002ED178FF